MYRSCNGETRWSKGCEVLQIADVDADDRLTAPRLVSRVSPRAVGARLSVGKRVSSAGTEKAAQLAVVGIMRHRRELFGQESRTKISPSSWVSQ